MEFLIVIWIIFAIIGAVMAGNRNRSTLGWAVICGFTGLIGILILAIAGKNREAA